MGQSLVKLNRQSRSHVSRELKHLRAMPADKTGIVAIIVGRANKKGWLAARLDPQLKDMLILAVVHGGPQGASFKLSFAKVPFPGNQRPQAAPIAIY